ncbi:unnamed protein product [Phytophthora fragariaefolia]|uniref:Unnamed protein product n=1 Tax=Phytophthora fragariaefolia TaxID=1490495 RepID=A0A9W6XSU6_9STRA|nr:unnamed protein product [Phytophthora fragariaefolia]
MVTPRSSNRADRLARDTEASNAQRGNARASSGRSCRRFVPRDDSSDDDSGEDDYYRKEDAEYDDSSDELARQVREVSEMERLNSTPRLELVTHRPLVQIKAFSGLQKPLRTSPEDETALTVVMSGVERPRGTDIDGTVTTDTGADMTVEWTTPVTPPDSSSEIVEDRSTDDDQSGSDYADAYHSDEHDRHVAAANGAERRTEAIGTYGRSENRGRRGDFPNKGLDRNSRHQGPDRRSRQYGPCAACGGANHYAHYCFRRCKLCKQVHDAGKCDTFQTMSTYLRTTLIRKTSQWSYRAFSQRRFKLGSPLTETGLVPIWLPQLASPPVDADCVYAFVGESKWLMSQRREEVNEVNTTEIEKERNGSFSGEASNAVWIKKCPDDLSADD